MPQVTPFIPSAYAVYLNTHEETEDHQEDSQSMEPLGLLLEFIPGHIMLPGVSL
jgi:hypothetical protein